MDGGEEGVAVEELAVAGELLDAVDAAVAFDLDGDVLAVGVEGHDVDGADCGGVFAADELGAGADAVDLFGEITLEVVFDARKVAGGRTYGLTDPDTRAAERKNSRT